jgi:hypothetical protein
MVGFNPNVKPKKCTSKYAVASFLKKTICTVIIRLAQKSNLKNTAKFYV